MKILKLLEQGIVDDLAFRTLSLLSVCNVDTNPTTKVCNKMWEIDTHFPTSDATFQLLVYLLTYTNVFALQNRVE